jgi:hypothetical protein
LIDVPNAENYDKLIDNNNFSASTDKGNATAELTGRVRYKDGTTAPYTANLVKQGDKWLITALNVGS